MDGSMCGITVDLVFCHSVFKMFKCMCTSIERKV